MSLRLIELVRSVADPGYEPRCEASYGVFACGFALSRRPSKNRRHRVSGLDECSAADPTSTPQHHQASPNLSSNWRVGRVPKR